jgi:preprotein translocase subunit SecD
MDRALRYKTLFLVFLVALSAAYLVPSIVNPEELPGWFARVFNKRVKLGNDLKGGLHIVYRVDLDKAVDDKAGEIKGDLELKFAEAKPKKIDATVETPRPNPATGVPLGAVIVTYTDPADIAAVEKTKDTYFAELASLTCPPDRDKDKTRCYFVSSDYAEKIRASAVDQAIKTIRDRVDRSGVADPTIIKKGEDIVVELPGTDDKENEHIREIINRTAQLEFKIVDDGNKNMLAISQHVGLGNKDNSATDPVAKERGIKAGIDTWTNENTDTTHQDYYLSAKDRHEYLTKEQATDPDVACSIKNKVAVDGKYDCLVTGRTVLQQYIKSLPKELQPDDNHQMGYEEQTSRAATAVGKAPEKSWRTYYLHRAAKLNGTAVASADVTWDQTTNRPEVAVNFTHAGGQTFGQVTKDNVGRRMAVILDDKITSAPTLQTAILDGRARITMGGGDNRIIQQEAEDLVNVLRTGALPAPLVEIQSSQFGALLGQDAIDKAKLSMGVGAILVILLMIGFYRFSGLIANFAMLLNILFQVAILAAFQAVLTLPGIAGLVLTVGMAVDSNIIIYERIREELRSGKSVRGAVDAGFGRAFWTVFDAHVTNFVAGFVLMEYGTGPIRGFAVTLLIGVVCNLFTSTWVSRLFFEYYVNRKRSATATLSI